LGSDDSVLVTFTRVEDQTGIALSHTGVLMNTSVTPASPKSSGACSSDPAHNRHRLICVASGVVTAVGAGLSPLVDPGFILMAGFGGLLLITTALVDTRG